MSGLFNAISKFNVKEYTSVPKETDTEDDTSYEDVDFSLNFSSAKTIQNSGLAASFAENHYKKETIEEKKTYEFDEKDEEDEGYKIIGKYKEDDNDGGFDSEF